jgi:hypothetical protein
MTWPLTHDVPLCPLARPGAIVAPGRAFFSPFPSSCWPVDRLTVDSRAGFWVSFHQPPIQRGPARARGGALGCFVLSGPAAISDRPGGGGVSAGAANLGDCR